MVKQPDSPHEPRTGFDQDFDHHVVLFPTRYAAYVPKELPTQSAGCPAFGVLPTPEGGTVVWALR